MLCQGARVMCAVAIFGALMGCDEISQPEDGIEAADGNSKSWELSTANLGDHMWPQTHIYKPPIRLVFEWDRITGEEQSICITIGGLQVPLESNGELFAGPWRRQTITPKGWETKRSGRTLKDFGVDRFGWTVAAEVSAGAIVLVITGDYYSGRSLGGVVPFYHGITAAKLAMNGRELLVSLGECAGG